MRTCLRQRIPRVSSTPRVAHLVGLTTDTPTTAASATMSRRPAPRTGSDPDNRALSDSPSRAPRRYPIADDGLVSRTEVMAAMAASTTDWSTRSTARTDFGRGVDLGPIRSTQG